MIIFYTTAAQARSKDRVEVHSISLVFIQHVHRVGGSRLAGAVPGVDGMGGGGGRAVDGGADAVLDGCHYRGFLVRAIV